MDFVANSFELTRLIFLVGALASLLYKKRFGVTPGGMIVPGILALTLFAKWESAILILVSALVCWLLYKLSFSRFPLAHRWQTLIHISLSAGIGLILTDLLSPVYTATRIDLTISLIVPGLIALSIKNSGLQAALTGLTIATASTFFVGWLLQLLLPGSVSTELGSKLATYKPLSLHHPLISIAISLLLAFLVYYFFKVRAGGYVIAPFIAVVTFSSPVQAGLLAIAAAASYLLIQLILRYSLIFGLERFFLSLLISSTFITLLDFSATIFNIPGYRPDPLLLVLALAVTVNDLSLRPLNRSLFKGVIPAQLGAHVVRFFLA